MVRVNLVNPKKLADQHLIAEYNEILMLVAYIKKHPKLESIPRDYCLGRGHMIFFKNKLMYLKNRHEKLKSEMRKRGFNTNKTLKINSFGKKNRIDWSPRKKDFNLIKKRLIMKLKLKPRYYRYYGKHKTTKFFIRLLEE